MIEPENECPTRKKRFIRHLLKPRFIVLALPFVLLLAACSQSTPTIRPPLTSAVVALVHQPTGTADLNWNPETTHLTVTVQMSGLTPSSTHPAHIHQGTCQTMRGILFVLHPVVANAVGIGTSQTVIPDVTNGIPFSGWTLAIQNGPGLTNADQVLPIACVTVHNPRFRHVFRYDLNPTPAADQNVSGQARLTITQHHLTVMVVVHGLVPGSMHMEHIHSGTCAQQGEVLYSLHTLIADKNGTATATTIIPTITQIPTQGWYVNVHRSAVLINPNGHINPTNFDPIACGDIG
jgi:hypothetical protein